jgi:hypothetical protein
MPSKKRVHLQQSGIISLAKSRSNLHQEFWEKQVDLPNCWDNHKLCKWVAKSYKKLYCIEIITKACLLRCKITHTHTDYCHHWYIRTRLHCGHIFMTRYAKSHTHRLQSSLIHQNKVTMQPYLHDEICKITYTHRSCPQVVDLAARGHWVSPISVDGLENSFLACIETTKLSKSALLVCKSILWVEGERIGHKMNLFILMPGGSGLPTPDTATRKEYVTRILLAAVLEGWATQSPPITRILLATKRSRRRRKR